MRQLPFHRGVHPLAMRALHSPPPPCPPIHRHTTVCQAAPALSRSSAVAHMGRNAAPRRRCKRVQQPRVTLTRFPGAEGCTVP